MTDLLHPKTAAEAAEAFMRNVPTDDPKMPEPVAFIDSLQRGRPDCVTSLKYCSVLQHERGDHLRYIPLITTEAAQAYAEALAAARVAQERWADAVMSELDRNGQAEAIVRCVTGQPPETGK